MWKESGLNRFSGRAKNKTKQKSENDSSDSNLYNKNVCLFSSIRWRPKIDNLMDRLAVMMTYQNELKKAPAKTTAPKEFSLTQPKPPAVPLPELIPLQEKWKPVSEKNMSNISFKRHIHHTENCICMILFDARM